MIRLEWLVAPLLLAACGSGGFYGEFVEACGATGDAPEELCECMAAYTETNLDGDQKEFLLAEMRGDEGRAAEIEDEMGKERAEQVEMLMAGSFGCGGLERDAQAGGTRSGRTSRLTTPRT